jgi:adenylate kinase
VNSDEELSILIVGICGSGKSSVVTKLQEMGFDVRACAQEHSCVKSMWRKLDPDVLIVLDCSYETIKSRRNVSWGLERIKVQKEKLEDALNNCDLYLNSDNLTLEETVEKIINYLEEKRLIQKRISSKGGNDKDNGVNYIRSN